MVHNSEFLKQVLESARELTGVRYYKKDGQLMIDAVIYALEKLLAEGETVEFRGFGRFQVHDTKPRKIACLDGVERVAPSRKVVRFSPGARLKREVAQQYVHKFERVD